MLGTVYLSEGHWQQAAELYEPFILHNEHVFECENARLLSAALPADEKHAFEFDPESAADAAFLHWCYGRRWPGASGQPVDLAGMGNCVLRRSRLPARIW